MLRRNSSHGPSRRKSTSSFRSRHDTIDPAEAQLHAQAAAAYAFARAQERNSTDPSRLARNNSATNHQNLSQPRQQEVNSNLGNQALKRQQSVRFVGPNAVNRRKSTGRKTEPPTLIGKPNTATLRPVALTTNAPVPAVYRPPSRSSSLGKGSLDRSAAQNYASTTAFDEYYTREDDFASTPSSFERHAERAIRKSKSMFNPLGRPNVFYSNGSPDRITNNSNTPRSQENEIPLRAPKSMSFLRGGSCERNDEAVQMARDRFFVQATEQRLREQPSFILRSKASRQEKPFRKSLRSSSGKSGTTDSTESSRELGLKDKARKVSQSLKNKLRKVFGRSKEESVAIPPQQVDAVETHVRAYAGQLSTNHDDFLDIPQPDHAAFAHVATRVPSLRAIASNQQLRSRAGSVRSFQSDLSDDKSRVTSWTNNSTVNTINSQGPRSQQQERDQRLSIINETGTHISKASFHRPNVKNQFSAYPAFHRPGHAQGPRPGGVDSARVYSALMKRLDQHSSHAVPAVLQQASTETLRADQPTHDQSDSVKSTRSQQKPWIRQVSQDGTFVAESVEKHVQDCQLGAVPSVYFANTSEDPFGQAYDFRSTNSQDSSQSHSSDDVFFFKPASNNGNPFERGQFSKSSGGCSLTDAEVHYHPTQDPSGLTQQEKADRDDPMPNTKVIREARSAFFGGSTFRIDRTTSPYRRALADTDASVIKNDNALARQSSSTRNVSPHRYPATVSTTDDDYYSESVYSRTTGAYNSQAESCESIVPIVGLPTMPSEKSSGGGAVIINSTTYRSSHPRHRDQSSAGSNEWKQWMSSEVARLERPENGTSHTMRTSSNDYHVRHRREHAQMTDDDTDVVQKRIPAVKQPLGLVQQTAYSSAGQQPLKPILKNRSATSLNEIGEAPNWIPQAPPIPPPLPTRSPLRQMQSRASLKSTPTVTPVTPSSSVQNHSANNRSVLHKRNISDTKSIRSAKSFDTINLSPAKLVKRTGRPAQYTMTPSVSPGGISAAVEKQFGGYGGQENLKGKEREDIYGVQETGILRSVMLDSQQLGSKQMVDMFLNSRRKRIAGGGSEDSGTVGRDERDDRMFL
ncbi:hypothetical protein ACMFMF_001226 [Clarireedia jacksonii]